MEKLMIERSWWMYLVLALVLVTAAPAAQANTILLPGTTVTPPDSLLINGTLLADTGVVSYTGIGGALDGTGQTVVLADPDNVFCAGCLDFVFLVTSSLSATTDIERISDSAFTGFMTDAGIATNAVVSISPTTADRSGSGQVVGFNFAPSNLILPGGSSSVLVIETNATNFTKGTLQIIDSDVAQVTSFAPTATVPEPGTMLLLGTGLVALGGSLRRRREAQ